MLTKAANNSSSLQLIISLGWWRTQFRDGWRRHLFLHRRFGSLLSLPSCFNWKLCYSYAESCWIGVSRLSSLGRSYGTSACEVCVLMHFHRTKHKSRLHSHSILYWQGNHRSSHAHMHASVAAFMATAAAIPAAA